MAQRFEVAVVKSDRRVNATHTAMTVGFGAVRPFGVMGVIRRGVVVGGMRVRLDGFFAAKPFAHHKGKGKTQRKKDQKYPNHLSLSCFMFYERSMNEKIHVKHILVAQEYEIEDVERKLNEGKPFEELAQKFSKCPSHKEGGDLGAITRGRTVAAFEQAAFDLSVGQISQPVRTQFGWHLIYRYL